MRRRLQDEMLSSHAVKSFIGSGGVLPIIQASLLGGAVAC